MGAEHRSHDLESHAGAAAFPSRREEWHEELVAIVVRDRFSFITATEIVSADLRAWMRKSLALWRTALSARWEKMMIALSADILTA
jgi:hypothetical protein